MDDWIARHRERWQAKSGLRRYYEEEIFAPLLEAAGSRGPLLELGAGPGFLTDYARAAGWDPVAVDIDPAARALTCDVHALPFPDDHFAAVVGVDCLHHFARPGRALREIARVLRPGGRLALCEPWTGALGWLFYRHLHHEDCFIPADPFEAFDGGAKSAMDGNAAVPKLVLHDRRDALTRACSTLEPVSVSPFGFLAYALTGGFQAWGLPAPVIGALARMEGVLPRAVMRHIALRAVFILEKSAG